MQRHYGGTLRALQMFYVLQMTHKNATQRYCLRPGEGGRSLAGAAERQEGCMRGGAQRLGMLESMEIMENDRSMRRGKSSGGSCRL